MRCFKKYIPLTAQEPMNAHSCLEKKKHTSIQSPDKKVVLYVSETTDTLNVNISRLKISHTWLMLWNDWSTWLGVKKTIN